MKTRDFLISRITSGRIYYDDVYIDIPDKHIAFLASQEYNRVYEMGKEEIYTSEDIINVLIGYNLWSPEDEENLQITIPNKISELKVEICDAGIEYAKLAFEIKELNKKLGELFRRR